MSEAGKKTLQDLGVVNDAGQPIDGGGEEWRTLQEGAGSEFATGWEDDLTLGSAYFGCLCSRAARQVWLLSAGAFRPNILLALLTTAAVLPSRNGATGTSCYWHSASSALPAR
jgi:hypothetical protein